jgi:hypothetical protein
MSAGESVAGDIVHVVADRFGGFAGNTDVITLGALRRAPASAESAESGDSRGRAGSPPCWLPARASTRDSGRSSRHKSGGGDCPRGLT